MEQLNHSAQDIARSANRALLCDVVPCLLEDPRYRKGMLSEEKQKQLSTGRVIDGRPSLWTVTSGKGSPAYADGYRNVSLIDHSLSVAGGGMVLCSYTEIHHGAPPDEELQREVFTIGLVGLFHDLNKLLRESHISSERVKAELQYLLSKPEIASAIRQHGTELDANTIFQLVNLVEAGTAMTGTEEFLAPRSLRNRVIYVRMADKLDSAYQTLGTKGGISGVLTELKAWETKLPEVLRHWRHISLYDAAHPYLLDELLRHLSHQCVRITGISPLVETHHDGQIDLLLPESSTLEIVNNAITGLTNGLRSGFEIALSTTKLPSIVGGSPNWNQLKDFFIENPGQIASLLVVGQEDLAFFQQFQTEAGFGLQFSDKLPKAAKTLTPLALDPDQGNLLTIAAFAALTIIALEHPNQLKKTVRLTDTKHRWSAVETWFQKEGCPFNPPDELRHKLSQRTWQAMIIASKSALDPDLFYKLFGDTGLIRQFYSGTIEDGELVKPGVRQALIGDRDDELLRSVAERYQSLLAGEPILDGMQGRFESTQGCLITGEPGYGRIEQKDGLYAIKASQFSTRRGRPARLGNGTGQTYLSPASFVEHKLRARRHGLTKADMPITLSSPTVSGLFAELRLDDELEADYGLFDMVRQDHKKGKVLHGPEVFQRRCRLARQEALPNKLFDPKKDDQLDWLERLVRSIRRTGRQFHIFRGGVTSQPEILYLDCMPPTLKRLAGGKQGFRLEELDTLYANIRLAKAILATKGLGHALLNSLFSPTQRYGALCQAKVRIDEHTQLQQARNRVQELPLLSEAALQVATQLEEAREKMTLTEKDNRLITLAHKAAKLQRSFGSGASRNEQLLLFKLMMGAARDAAKGGYTSDQELIRVIAGQVERKLGGSKYAGSRKYRDGVPLFDGCIDISEFFVNEIWHQVLSARFPSRRELSLMSDIYRVEMQLTYRSRREQNSNTEQTN